MSESIVLALSDSAQTRQGVVGRPITLAERDDPGRKVRLSTGPDLCPVQPVLTRTRDPWVTIRPG